MTFGRARCASYTVPPCAAAQQDYRIPRCGAFAADIICRSRRYNRAAFQTLGNIAFMVKLRHMARGKAYLVAVRGIARRGGLAQLTLRQLAGKGFIKAYARIARAGYAHSLMDVCPAGQRIAYAAAYAGGCAAERFNLGWVIMGFVFEHQQPVLLLAINRSGNMYGAGVYFLAFVKLRQQAALFKHLCAYGSNVHKRLRAFCGLLRAVNLNAGGNVSLICGPNSRVVNLHMVYVGGECRVAAMVGPVGIHHADFGDCGVTMLIIAEIALQILQIVQIHCKPQFIAQRIKRRTVHGNKALYCADGGGDIIFHLKRLRQRKRCFTAFNRVDYIFLYGRNLFFRQHAFQSIHPRCTHNGAFPLRQYLDALSGGIRPLIVLTGQILHGKNSAALRRVVAHGIELRL